MNNITKNEINKITKAQKKAAAAQNAQQSRPVEEVKKAEQAETTKRAYSYYSNVLNKPFDSLIELERAEEAYYDKLREKEDKAAQKKADAAKVEEAFKGLNATRKAYKDTMAKLAERYSEDLKLLKKDFAGKQNECKALMAEAEDTYAAALKAFTDKYPEGYHLTLKDGDFETTISSKTNVSNETMPVSELLNIFFGW
jgi:chromosome segregation ATPase